MKKIVTSKRISRNTDDILFLPEEKKKKIQWNIFAVLLLFFFIALSARMLRMILDPVLQRDAALYLYLAERWHETGDYSQTMIGGTIVPPLPLFVIKKMMDFGLDAETAGRSMALFFGSLIPILGFYISYAIFKDALISGISALIFIFHPSLISYSVHPLRENYYLFFFGLIVLLVINGIKKRRLLEWGLCGIVLSFSFFSRYESLELLVIIPLIVLYLFLKKRIDKRKVLLILCVFGTSVLVTCILLMSMTNYNLSFILKISKYSEEMNWAKDDRDFVQINP